MNSARSEELVVGLVSAVLVPLIAARVLRGLRTGRLPIYHTYLDRDADRAKFAVLLLFHLISLVVIGTIAADLLFDLGIRDLL